jgi:hypothetical protein
MCSSTVHIPIRAEQRTAQEPQQPPRLFLLLPPIGGRHVLLEANLAPFFVDFRGTRATLADDTNTAFSGSSRHKRKKIKVMHPEIAGAKPNFE